MFLSKNIYKNTLEVTEMIKKCNGVNVYTFDITLNFIIL